MYMHIYMCMCISSRIHIYIDKCFGAFTHLTLLEKVSSEWSASKTDREVSSLLG